MIRFKLIRFLAAISILSGSIYSPAQDHVGYLQQVQRAGVSVSLVSPKNPSNIGDGSAVLVKVSGSGVLAPSGIVTFSAVQANIANATAVATASISLDSSGNAAWIFGLPPGTYQIFATYSGDNEYQAGDAVPLTQIVVGPADFTLSLDSGSLAVKQGSTWSGSLTATSVNDFQGTITLLCSGGSNATQTACLPGKPMALTPGGSAQFPVQITTTATSLNILSSGLLLISFSVVSRKRQRKQVAALSLLTLLLLVTGCGGVRYEQTNGTPKGNYTMTVTGQSGSLSHAVSFVVSVQ
jgi:hypothetical protein